MAEALTISEIELYEILRSKLGDKEAKTLVEYVEDRVEKKFEEKKDILATKGDIALVKEDIALVRQELASTKAEIIKWMFLFWIGQLASLIAVLQMFFK